MKTQNFYAKIIEGCRLSSVVEHFHGKEGVSSSNLEGGSIFCAKKKPQLIAEALERLGASAMDNHTEVQEHISRRIVVYEIVLAAGFGRGAEYFFIGKNSDLIGGV